MTTPAHEALGLLEIDGLPRAVRAQDAALKRAPVEIVACAPVTPGKVILVIAGAVAPVEESLAAAVEVAGKARLDELFLPGVHPDVVAALRGVETKATPGAALGLFELTTAAAAVVAADAALKSTRVVLGRMHLAAGFGGKAWLSVQGELGDVEAAAAAIQAIAGERLRGYEVIPAPHEDLDQGLFVRPWPMDPGRGPR